MTHNFITLSLRALLPTRFPTGGERCTLFVAPQWLGRGNGKRRWVRRTTTPGILRAPRACDFLFRSGARGNCKGYAGDAARSLIHLHLRRAPADPGLPPGEQSAMNGRVDYLITEEEINLTRGPSGRRGRWRESLLSSLVLRSRVYLAGEQAGPT